MKALLGFAAVIVAASVSAAQAQPNPATTEPSAEAGQSTEIVVESQRLAKELKNTTLTQVRGRDMRATFRLRANGTFVSAMNGQQSDFGEWHVERDTICFDGRMLPTFCSLNLFGKYPGDTWSGMGLDGKKWEASLKSND